jgi:hypothetical protein
MGLFEWLAIIGAFAWLPTLIKFLRDLFIIPEVTIITQSFAEIGYTTFGPIFNTRLAFSTKNRSIVISSIKLILVHENGKEKTFSWQGIVQNLGVIKNLEGSSIPFEKEQSVLAIKLNEKEVEERFIRFQEDEFRSQKENYEAKTSKKIAYLQEKGSLNYDEFLNCEEMNDLYSFIKQWFNWEKGKYYVKYHIESPDKFILKDYSYNFELTAIDIDALEKNKDLIEFAYEDLLKMNVQGYSPKEPFFNWRNPKIKKDHRETNY